MRPVPSSEDERIPSATDICTGGAIHSWQQAGTGYLFRYPTVLFEKKISQQVDGEKSRAGRATGPLKDIVNFLL
jgi:hypothetical protein